MSMLDWEELEQTCLNCRKCALADTRTNVVFGVGPRDAEIMLIGEGPGENEDLKGEPFVGRAGKLLDEMLAVVDLDLAQIDSVRRQLPLLSARRTDLYAVSHLPRP